MAETSAQWNLLTFAHDVLPNRLFPLVVPINATEILIMGGSDGAYKSDVCVFNTATQEVRRDKESLKLSDSDNQFKFCNFYNQSYVTRNREVIGRVRDADRKYHLISYRYGADTVSKLW